jgi:hemerythrin superfamily protein
MATRTNTTGTASRSRSNGKSSGNGAPREKAAFEWGSAAGIASAAIGGAMIAVAANLGRKAAVQGMSAAAGSWDESLAAEHQAVLGLFDKMLATKDDQVRKRALLLMQLGHALDKHAYAEEHVVYPCLRESNDDSIAALLETEHGEVKTYLHRLSNMAKNAPEWLGVVAEFRDSVAAHAKMEEEEVFPHLRAAAGDEMNKRITREVNKAGFMMA